MTVVPRVDTARLRLREFRASNFDAYAENLADPVAMKSLSGVVDRRTAWRGFAAGARIEHDGHHVELQSRGGIGRGNARVRSTMRSRRLFGTVVFLAAATSCSAGRGSCDAAAKSGDAAPSSPPA